MSSNSSVPPPSTGGASPGRRSSGLVPILALAVVLLLCVCGVIAFAGLNALGFVTMQVNLFPTGTPTFVSVAGTATPAASETPLATAAPATAIPLDTPTGAPTAPPTIVLPTPVIPRTFVAFDADFFGDECPLFEGDNEIRTYTCDFGTYAMVHKEATTRYTFAGGDYGDGVIEATGFLAEGTGKYEYGIVFRADTDGSLYYVFTVSADGKYNVAIYQNEKYTDLIPYTASPFVNTGILGSNDLKVVMQGSHFDFFVNEHYLGSTTDSTISSGVAGLFFYNAEPKAEVDFAQFAISIFTPPTPTPPAGAQTGSPTPAAQGAESTAAPVKPGIYVNSLRLSPRAPRRGEPVTFFASFVNSTGRAASVKWFVEIWEAAADKKNAYGQADGRQRDIPVGTNERATGDSWKVAGGGPCIAFRARVVYEDDQSRRIPFKRTNGSDLWTPFQVCP